MAVEEWRPSKKTALKDFQPNLLQPYLQDPFEFYGGNLKLSEVDKVHVTKDCVYKAQESQNRDLKEQIENLENQNELLLAQFQQSQEQMKQMQTKLAKKSKKIKLERALAKEKLEETCVEF